MLSLLFAGCNVGYGMREFVMLLSRLFMDTLAFVNFIHVQDLLHFARTKLGIKW